MEALLLYQVKVAVLVAVLFGGYRLLLGRETFHRFNRSVLITIALLSFVLPLFHITRHPIAADNVGAVEENTQLVASDLDATAAQTSAPVNMFALLLVLYGAGVLFVLVKKGISVWTMSRIIRKGRYADRSEGVDVIESDQIPGPLNWMRYVVMPREWLESENASVWKHENLHAHRWHSLDLLMADIMTAFQWFNPVMILLRKEFELIHEYEADRAVIDSGANPKEYKLMLVNAVAASRGLAMTSWLKQSNLKKRIDMMDKKQSNGWSRLRVLFIPAIAYFFLFATANVAMAEDNTFRWPVFEDGKTWIYQDGTCKVRTFNGVEASMKVSELADYLANYKDFKTTRMTLMYTYPIEGLAEVQPIAEQLVAKGIRISVANNDEILTQMTMPEYRAARIFDLGGGQYRFELNCNLKSNNRLAAMFGDSSYIKYPTPSITGDINLMKKWINLFDGHGVSIYPDKMSARDADILSQATFGRGIDQFSIVTDIEEEEIRAVPVGIGISINPRSGFDHNITIIPKNFNIESHYPGMDAKTAAKQMLYDLTNKYYGKGLHIHDPKVFFNPEDDWIYMNLVNADDEFIMVFTTHQYRDQWVTGLSECEIEVNGQWIKEIKNEGMDGFLNHYFWNPTYGFVYQTIHFPALPKDVKTINFREKTLNINMKKIQVTEDVSMFDNVRSIEVNGHTYLKTTHLNDDVKDEFAADRVDFGENETTVYCLMYIRANHSFPGHIGNDYKLTLANGKVLDAIRIEGLPVNEDFDRHGDWVSSPYQVIFPAISEEEWNEGAPTLSGSVCHEPVSIKLWKPGMTEGISIETVSEIAQGTYRGQVHTAVVEDDGALGFKPYQIVKVTVDEKGKISFSGDESGLFTNGKYDMVWKHPSEIKELAGTDIANDSDASDLLILKIKRTQLVFRVNEQIIDKDSPYYENYGGMDHIYILSPVRFGNREIIKGEILQMTLDPIVE